MAGVPVPILLLSVDTKAKESEKKKVIICAGVPQALTKQLHAGQWAGAVAAVLGGKGGGKVSSFSY
jgi:alanyl-tRNA synthetase